MRREANTYPKGSVGTSLHRSIKIIEMPYRYYEATHHELDPKLGEYSRLEWAQGIPVVGELVPMGSERIWEVVAVDEFRLEEQTQPEFEYESIPDLSSRKLRPPWGLWKGKKARN